MYDSYIDYMESKLCTFDPQVHINKRTSNKNWSFVAECDRNTTVAALTKSSEAQNCVMHGSMNTEIVSCTSTLHVDDTVMSSVFT